MKITVLTENLQKKLPLLGHAISNKNQLPILSQFFLETRDGKLIIHATDLEIGYEVTIPVSIELEGATTVPAKLFSELMNSLPPEKITLEKKDGSLIITSQKTNSILQTMNKEEYPILYEDKGENVLQADAVSFKKDLAMVAFAASIETTRPALSGVLMKQEQDGVTIVATDGYRLSLRKDAKQKEEEGKSLIIPARVIREVLSFKEESSIDVYVSGSHNQIIFSQEDTILIGRLIEAEFPMYQKIIPTDASTKVNFEREDLLKAVKTCSLFARESANIITMSIKKEAIVVSAKTPSLGENTVEIEASLVGEENDIAFNARYVIDLLSTLQDEQMVFEMTGPLNAGVFKIANDPNFLHLIMPIRT